MVGAALIHADRRMDMTKQVGDFRPLISSCARFIFCQTVHCRPTQVVLLRINPGIKYERTLSLNITVTKFYRAVSHTKTADVWNVTPFSVAVSCQKSVVLIQGIHKRMVRFQKLTRNLFLTLHGHNIHRQQRQLSKFLMR